MLANRIHPCHNEKLKKLVQGPKRVHFQRNVRDHQYEHEYEECQLSAREGSITASNWIRGRFKDDIETCSLDKPGSTMAMAALPKRL